MPRHFWRFISYCTHSGLRRKKQPYTNDFPSALYLIARIADCDLGNDIPAVPNKRTLYLIARIADCDSPLMMAVPPSTKTLYLIARIADCDFNKLFGSPQSSAVFISYCTHSGLRQSARARSIRPSIALYLIARIADCDYPNHIQKRNE